MARGRASIQFTKLPQVVPVWWTFPIITSFPSNNCLHKKKKRAIVKSISTLGYFLIFQVQFWLNGIITKKIFLSSLQGAWADIKRRDHQCDIFVIPRVEYRCIANYIQQNIFEDLRALDFKREKKFFGNSSDYWRYRHIYHEWAYCVKRSTV